MPSPSYVSAKQRTPAEAFTGAEEIMVAKIVIKLKKDAIILNFFLLTVLLLLFFCGVSAIYIIITTGAFNVM